MQKNILSEKITTFFLAVMVFLALASYSANAENVKIIRDEFGVPHIYASTEEGLFFGQGYAMAEDRIFQLEMCRQAAQGRLAATYGRDYLQFDMLQRREIYSDKEIQKFFLTLPEKQKSIYLAFAAGINSHIKEIIELPDKRMPLEFHKMGIKPSLWSGEDVIRVFINSFWRFFDYDQELENAAFYKFALDKYGDVQGKAIFDEVVWLDDPEAPVTAPRWNAMPKKQTRLERYNLSPGIKDAALNYIKEKKFALDTLKNLSIPYRSGSYALIISGKLTSTGNPMLLGGPQVGFGKPSYLYESGLHKENLDCHGFSYIGVPGFITGQNNDISWTITTGIDNQVDFFIERLNPDDHKKYWYKGKWVDMEKETFIIKVKGEKDVFYDVYRTIHGPVVVWDMKDPKNPVAYTKSWAFKGDILENWNSSFNLLKARNSDEFYNAVRTASFSLNWFCIDRKGDISFIHSGRYPIRPSEVDPRLPADGTGKSDWKGFVELWELPQYKNPQEGFMVNWNNKPAPLWNNGEMSIYWGSQNKVALFSFFVNKKGDEGLSFQDVKEIDRSISTSDIYAPALKPLLITALSTHQAPLMIEVRRLLSGWNDRYEDKNEDGYYDSPGAVIFDTWWKFIVKDVFADDLETFYTLTFNEHGATLPLKVLSKAPGLRYDFLNGKDPHTVMIASLEKAITRIKEEYGQDSSRWLKKVNNLSFLPEVPISKLPMGEDKALTIPSENRGSAIQIVEASKNWVKGVGVIPPGISGFINKHGEPSPHYTDQLKLYIERKYKDILFYPEDIQHHIETIKIREFKAGDIPR